MLVVIDLCATEGHCAGGRPLSFGSRPWCDVRAVASNAQPAFAWHTRKRHCAGSLLGGGKTRELAKRACRVALVVIGPRAIERHCGGRRSLTLSSRPWCDVRTVASSSAQPAFAWPMHERNCAGCLSGGDQTCKLAARVRHSALVVIDLCATEGHCTDGRPLSFGARPWCDVRAVTSNRMACEHAQLRWLSLGRWENTQACRAPTVPRWLRSVYAILKGTAPAGGLFISVQDRSATCELWPPTHSRHSRGTREPVRWLSLGRWQNTRGC